MNLSTMNKKGNPSIEDAIEAKHACMSCGIMITALLLQTDIVNNDLVLKTKAYRAVQILNQIAQEINMKYLLLLLLPFGAKAQVKDTFSFGISTALSYPKIDTIEHEIILFKDGYLIKDCGYKIIQKEYGNTPCPDKRPSCLVYHYGEFTHIIGYLDRNRKPVKQVTIWE